MSRRDDEAFMSINTTDAAIPLIIKYTGTEKKIFISTRFRSGHFPWNGWFKKITRFPDLDFYDLIHAFRDIARNVLYFDKDDVAQALNYANRLNEVEIVLFFTTKQSTFPVKWFQQHIQTVKNTKKCPCY